MGVELSRITFLKKSFFFFSHRRRPITLFRGFHFSIPTTPYRCTANRIWSSKHFPTSTFNFWWINVSWYWFSLFSTTAIIVHILRDSLKGCGNSAKSKSERVGNASVLAQSSILRIWHISNGSFDNLCFSIVLVNRNWSLAVDWHLRMMPRYRYIWWCLCNSTNCM